MKINHDTACKQCLSVTGTINGIDHNIRALLRRLEKGWGSISDLAALKESRAKWVDSQVTHYEAEHQKAA